MTKLLGTWNKQQQQWSALVLFLFYLLTLLGTNDVVHGSILLFPASGLGLGVLFFEGLTLWPAIYLAALIAGIAGGWTLPSLLLLPAAYALEAVLGGLILRNAQIDPLFRSKRDVLWLFGAALTISFIIPLFDGIAALLSSPAYRISMVHFSYSASYVSVLSSLVLVTPFVLRWLAKPRFSRSRPEILETVAAFSVLIAVDLCVFILQFPSLGRAPLSYFLLIPLFWIALRLRPRFVSLALLITASFALSGIFLTGPAVTSAAYVASAFNLQLFLIAFSACFFIIASLEEERRLNSNLTRSQVAVLQNAVARVSSESSAKNDFIAVLAHELRNPLAPIMSGIDFLKLTEDRPPDELETLSMMEDRMQTVRRLLDDLLDISRITEGKVALKTERINLEIVMRSAILSTEHYRHERHQSLAVKSPKENLWILGDAVRIEQVFSNLLTNASKYSDSGDAIEVALQRRGGDAEITVTDEGVGILLENIEDIFTPFHQVNLGERTKKGLGIGLALVRSFVEMHQGSVSATSRGGGQGSTFTVLLPLANGEEAADAAVPEKWQLRNPLKQRPHAGPRVLIVDDMDEAAWSIGKLLTLKGCSVSYAYDGAQAIKEAKNPKPDTILLDVGLPELDGYSVAKTIRTQGFTGKLIALTGYGVGDAQIKGKEAGFDDYLVKPAGLRDLLRVFPELA